MIFLMIFSLGISPLVAAEPISDIHGNTVFVYTEMEHQNIIVALEELKQWRTLWPQFQVNYNTLLDSNTVWKTNYNEEAAANYDLRVQRNVMVGVSGVLITVITVVLAFFN